jgi:2Fe-2S ferredoxin
MARVTYIESNGEQHQVEVPNGDSVMQGAVYNSVPGIVGECGGGLACATCHCYVDEAWREKVGPASGPESEMLEFSATETKPGSRLSCQIVVGEGLDGLVVRLPEAQY